MDEYIGIVKLFGGNFAPVGWAFCNGQLMSIAQYTAVFAILGTTYGGDGVTTFALPNLSSRGAVGMGQGPGLSYYDLGEQAGTEAVTLTSANLPAHIHVVTGTVSLPVNDSNADAEGPVGAYLGTPSSAIYSSSSNATAAPAPIQGTAQPTGNNLPISLLQPTLALSYIICLEGIFPSRN